MPLHPWILFLNVGKSRSFSVAEVEYHPWYWEESADQYFEPHAYIVEQASTEYLAKSNKHSMFSSCLLSLYGEFSLLGPVGPRVGD